MPTSFDSVFKQDEFTYITVELARHLLKERHDFGRCTLD